MKKKTPTRLANNDLPFPVWYAGKRTLEGALRLAAMRKLTLEMARRQVPPMWRNISLELSNVCNLKCKMCPYQKMTRKREFMSIDLYKKIVADAANVGMKFLCLSITNEPLMDDRLPEAIRYAKGRGLHVAFTSNATLAAPERMAEILTTGVDRINFSLDGATKDTYESIRIGASFETARSNILQTIRERNRRGLSKPSIVINFVAQQENNHEIAAFRSMWRGLADKLLVSPVENREGKGVWLDGRPQHAYPCGRTLFELSVLSNGKIALCCVDYEGSFILGDLSRQSIGEVRESSTFREVAELHLSGRGNEIGLCAKCHVIYDTVGFWWLKYLSGALRLPRLVKGFAEPI